MKVNKMTLKKTHEYLQSLGLPGLLPALQVAAHRNNPVLKAEYQDAPVPFYVVTRENAEAWARDTSQHKAGRPKKTGS